MAIEESVNTATPRKPNHKSKCGGCGCEEAMFLFYLHHKDNYRRLCLHCVLGESSGYFCPICFEVYDRLPPISERLMCLECLSISHISCFGPNFSRFHRCPPCANPDFTFFNPKRNIGGELAPKESGGRGIDMDSAKQLLAAAKLSSASMKKAVCAAGIEAEKRVEEAAVARKTAREAVELSLSLSLKERLHLD